MRTLEVRDERRARMRSGVITMGTTELRSTIQKRRERLSVVAAALLMSLALGCASSKKSGPYATPSPQTRNPIRAQELNAEAVKVLATDLDAAEHLLRDALTEDLYCGPAHNNLGVVYLKRDRLYEAANELEWAKKLMPGHPDPRLNLGLVFEKAVRTEDALGAYASALEIYSDHIASKQALARAQIRYSREDTRTYGLLEDIAMGGDSLAWRDWARKELQKRER